MTTTSYPTSPPALEPSSEPSSGPAQPPTSWHYLSHVVVRRTGFPFDWLEDLAVPAAEGLAEGAAQEREHLVRQTEHTLHDTFPAVVRRTHEAGDRTALKQLSRLRRRFALGRLEPADLPADAGVDRALVEELTAALRSREAGTDLVDALAQTLAGAEAQLSATMTRYAQSPEMRDAIFLTNPELFENSLDKLADGGEARRTLQLKLWAYLQRFCAKNDTASFFGPLNYARVAPGPAPVSYTTEPGRWAERDVFFGFWVAKALAETVSEDPGLRDKLPCRLHPLCRLDGAELWLTGTGRRHRLGRLARQVVELADGSLSLEGICARVGGPTVRAEVDRLIRSGVLVCRLDVPSTVFHPFEQLLEQVAEVDDGWPGRERWLGELRRFDALRAQFRDGDLAERRSVLPQLDRTFSELTGRSPRRKAGATYADRTLVYEECRGTMTDFTFSPEFFAGCTTRLEPVLDICAAHGALLQQHYRRLAALVFDELSPAGQPVPYSRFADAVRHSAAVTHALPDAALSRLVGGFVDLVRARTEHGVARLSRLDVDELQATHVPDRLRDLDCHVSPDVMLCADDLTDLQAGRYRLVLGEVHQVIYVWGSQLYFHTGREAAEAETAAHLAAMPSYADLGTLLKERQHKGLLGESFPGQFVEVGAVPQAHRSRLSVGDLEVVRDESGVRLRSRDGSPLQLYTAGDDQVHLWAFAVPRAMPIPVRFGQHTPRIEIDGTVYQRERWDLEVAEWGDDVAGASVAELMVRHAQVRLRHGIGRRVFVLAPSEPKPVYLDCATPLAVRSLRQLLLVNERLGITEMLPGPEDLWLTEPDGRYCVEFRMTGYRYRDRG